MAVVGMQFSWRWDSGMISLNLGASWKMSASSQIQGFQPAWLAAGEALACKLVSIGYAHLAVAPMHKALSVMLTEDLEPLFS